MSEIRLIDANALRERLLVLRSNIANVQCISNIFDICLTEVSNAPTVSTEDCEGCPYCPNSNSGIPIGVE